LDIDLAIKLSDILIEHAGLRSIDFSGGEPTTHDDFVTKKYKLLKWTKTHPEVNFAIHSNGIMLKPEVVNQLKGSFAKIGISLHSPNFETWNKLTNRKGGFPENAQKTKFKQLMSNIDYMVKIGIGNKVFIKSVIVRGYNDSEEELRAFLDFCAERGLHPKFFEFEPQYKDQEKYVVGRKELFEKLEKTGCSFGEDTPRHNDPNTYIPGVNFEYKANEGAKMGLHSIFGCGDKVACQTCYMYLCMFVKATEDGKGMYLKPCPVLDTRFDLSMAVKSGNVKQVLETVKKSREYLMLAPGMGIKEWNKEDEFKIDFC
jgi:molybdenum cofactor biosynthesis enzyme MoaA